MNQVSSAKSNQPSVRTKKEILRELLQLSDFALVSRLCDNVEHMTPDDEEFWIELEEGLSAGERLPFRIREKAARMVYRKERSAATADNDATSE